MATHYHYLLQGFAGRSGDTLNDVCVVDLIARSSDEAIGRAQIMVPDRAYWRVAQVTQHDPDTELATVRGAVRNGKVT